MSFIPMIPDFIAFQRTIHSLIIPFDTQEFSYLYERIFGRNIIDKVIGMYD